MERRSKSTTYPETWSGPHMTRLNFAELLELLGITKPEQNRPPIVAVFGSMRFEDHMKAVAVKEELAGRIVLRSNVNLGKMSPGDIPSHKTAFFIKNRLDMLHRYVIDLADEMIVVCPLISGSPYIDSSTARKVDYAKRTHTPVRYVH